MPAARSFRSGERTPRDGVIPWAAMTGGSAPPAATATHGAGRISPLLWLALAAATSPVILDLLQHWIAEPWARYSAIFALPLVVAATTPSEVGPRRSGYLWLGLAIAVELVAVGAAIPRVGRPSLPLAILGAFRLLGVGSLRAWVLALWLIPVPHYLLRFGSPELERVYLELAVALWQAFGATLELAGSTVRAASGELELRAWDAGLPLCALISGLVWWAALRRGTPIGRTVVRAGLGGLVALPVQALGVSLAVGCLAAGAPRVGRALLGHGLWLAVCALGLIGVLRSGRRSRDSR